MSNLKCSVIIVSAGSGKRMGGKVPKQYIKIKEIPVLARTVSCFQNCKKIDEIVIVTGKNEIEFCEKEIKNKYNFNKVKKIIVGGKERQESVFNGLKALDNNTDIVLIHDGVRPFIKENDIKKIIDDTIKYDCCVLGVKVKDPVKICNENNYISSTPDRNSLWIAQTPQSFKYDLIMRAHKKAVSDGYTGTDDSVLTERIGCKVKITEGSYDNIKITTQEDLYFSKAIIEKNHVDKNTD